MQVITVGLDIAKNVFQVHGVDGDGRAVLRRKVRRDQLLKLFGSLEPCLVGMEACATAHHWARELGALGHEVRLMPPAYVKAYVKRNKNDAADAEAICEAVTRPTMRFVPIKSTEAQSVLMLHRARHLLVRQRTAQVSAMRGHLAEYGIVAAKGISRLRDLLPVLDAGAGVLPELARQTLLLIAQLIEALTMQIRKIETELLAWHRTNPASQRLETIPGIGVITATALAATVLDAKAFRSGRQFAAWLGLVPRQNSSGGKERRWVESPRWATAICATCSSSAPPLSCATRGARRPPSASGQNRLLDRKPARLVHCRGRQQDEARIAWAVMAREEKYRATPAAA